MKKEENLTTQILKNNIYAVILAYSLSKTRVICSLIKQIIEYLLWVFYSAFFVRFILDAIQDEKPLKEIIFAIIMIGGISLALKVFLYYCDDVLFPLLDIKIYHGMYGKVYNKAENVDLKCYESSDFYNKFSMALDDMGTKLCSSIDNMSVVVGGTLGGILACCTMIEIDPWTIIFLIAPLIGNFVFAPKMNNIYYKRYVDGAPYERKISYINRIMYLKEYAKEFRLSNIFNVIIKKYNEAIEGKASIWRKYFNRSFIIGVFQYIFSYVIIFEGILLYGAYRSIISQRHMITFSQMAVLTSVMITASWVWVRVINAINRSTDNSLLVTNLRDFLEYKEKIPENQEGVIPDKNITSIEFRHVTFSYDNKKNVIEDLSFIIGEKESIVLVGHNGAGKSTIIKLLLRLYDPTEGVILVNQIDIRNYNLKLYRKLFTCAFQDGTLIPGTIRYNVLMGNTGTDKDVIRALKKSGIYNKICQLPKDIDTAITKEFDDTGELFSGGECQKVLVARAFANPAPVTVFDEPSSALDPISENELFSSILRETVNKISVLVSHRLSCVKDADYVFMLENGKVIERGTHRELLDMNGKYNDMYRLQERNYFALDDESDGDSR